MNPLSGNPKEIRHPQEGMGADLAGYSSNRADLQISVAYTCHVAHKCPVERRTAPTSSWRMPAAICCCRARTTVCSSWVCRGVHPGWRLIRCTSRYAALPACLRACKASSPIYVAVPASSAGLLWLIPCYRHQGNFPESVKVEACFGQIGRNRTPDTFQSLPLMVSLITRCGLCSQ